MMDIRSPDHNVNQPTLIGTCTWHEVLPDTSARGPALRYYPQTCGLFGARITRLASYMFLTRPGP